MTSTLFFYCCCIVVYLTTLTAVHSFSTAQIITLHAAAHQRRQPPLHFSVAPPDTAIDTRTLLYQAYTALTVKEVKDILRHYGAKVTGNKSELIDRLGEILDGKIKEDEQHPKYVAKERQKTLKEYNEMTLKELRDILKGRGLNSEGNKRELVHRVLISGYEAKSKLLAVINNNHDGDDNFELASSSLTTTTTDHTAPDATNNWQIIEPTIENCQHLTNDDTKDFVLGDGTELPFLSQLLFVNKPSGWSTLPTKQQLDNPTCPTYPCLSKSVVAWLTTDPGGLERLRHAQADEERWWNSVVLETEPQNSMQRRELKKRIRKHEEQLEKIFEPRPVHRLDIDTSGIVCIALTPTALRTANMLFEKKSVEKELDTDEGYVEKQYVALVEGSMDKESSTGTISHAIGKVWVDDHNEWACDVHDDGSCAFVRRRSGSSPFVPDTLRDAITLYKAVDWGTVQSKGESRNVTRVELTPVTGRGHQLRLHMASIDHPIVGDSMHGDERTVDKDDQLCLHASKLSMDSFCFASTNGDAASLKKCRIVVESAPPF